MSILVLTCADCGDSSNCSKVGVTFLARGYRILLATFETRLLGPTSIGVTRVKRAGYKYIKPKPKPKGTHKYTKVEIPHTQDKRTQLSSFASSSTTL